MKDYNEFEKLLISDAENRKIEWSNKLGVLAKSNMDLNEMIGHIVGLTASGSLEFTLDALRKYHDWLNNKE